MRHVDLFSGALWKTLKLHSHFMKVLVFCPHCSDPGFESNLRSLAECHPPHFLSSLKLSCQSSHEKAKNNTRRLR